VRVRGRVQGKRGFSRFEFCPMGRAKTQFQRQYFFVKFDGIVHVADVVDDVFQPGGHVSSPAGCDRKINYITSLPDLKPR